MQWLYSFAEQASSAGWLHPSLAYAFMVNALVAACLLGPLLGGLGTMVVAKRLAFFSEAVGHAAITGIALGILLGESPDSPFIGLFSFCLIFALLLHYVRNRTQVPYDTLVGVFLAIALALGGALLMYVAKKINIHLLENVLFGSILAVAASDIIILLVVGSVLCVLFMLCYNRMLLAAISPDIAKVRGIAVVLLDYSFVLMVTLVTIISVKVIGAILVGALLLIPAATARLLCRTNAGFVICSAVIATISCLLGTLLPMRLDLAIPSGAAIILLAGGFFLMANAYQILCKRGN
ncbi:metal ABC transporter permease [Motilimonas pumila]|uniref:Metal ABC transporter permease n=1 Tax=Motilimonas pumila TaxID=2303987 RepID=A0A418YF99_9GAMM|nr:metal ABC transporter permease [Motilimonas pumila]RJG47748.1 metal ABC transporter permease [Motilimonas pumila]